MPARDPIVSFEDEPLILVDAEDRERGYASKAEAHDGDGLLHRAFSIFLFNRRGELLVHQRSHEKRLWAGFWTNSCCSHPRRGEGAAEAAARRVREELGLAPPPLAYLFKFVYQAPFERAGEKLGSEHELCSVYAGRHDGPPVVNPHEIAEWRWIGPEDLDAELRDRRERYTPWLELEWLRLRRDHWHVVQALRL